MTFLRSCSAQAIDPVLADHPYDAKKVHDWTSLCIEDVLKGLQMLQKPFKYVGEPTHHVTLIVTCVLFAMRLLSHGYAKGER